jgi:hypothetical protein
MSEAIVIDTPQGIQNYRYLATLHGLRMEVEFGRKYGTPPTALPTRGMAFRSAKRILGEHGVTPRRTRALVLEQLDSLMRDMGFFAPGSAA